MLSLGHNHGRSQMLDAPATAIPANVHSSAARAKAQNLLSYKTNSTWPVRIGQSWATPWAAQEALPMLLRPMVILSTCLCYRGRFRTARARRQLFLAYPLQTTHLQKHARSSQNSMGCEFRTLGPMASIRLKKIPGVPAGAVGCRIQDPGIRGSRWWKTADVSHSARCAPLYDP